MLQWRMDKQTAIRLLGGSVKKAADAIGIKPQAIYQWPDPLPPRISDRVEACIARQEKASAAARLNVPASAA